MEYKKLIQLMARLACIDIYSPIAQFRYLFEHGDSLCGVVNIEDCFFIVMQGTNDLAGVGEDVSIAPHYHDELGFLHGGFYQNIPFIARKLLTILPLEAKIYCCGHSKGAAEASILAAILTLNKINVLHVALFGSPNPGFDEFSKWMQENISGISYRNTCYLIGDPIIHLPMLPYVPVWPHFHITSKPKGLNRFRPSCWHSSDLYYDAIMAI